MTDCYSCKKTNLQLICYKFASVCTLVTTALCMFPVFLSTDLCDKCPNSNVKLFLWARSVCMMYVTGKYVGIHTVVDSVEKTSDFHIVETSCDFQQSTKKYNRFKSHDNILSTISNLLLGTISFGSVFVGLYDLFFTECVFNMGYVSVVYAAIVVSYALLSIWYIWYKFYDISLVEKKVFEVRLCEM